MFNKSKLSLLIKAVSVTALSTGLIACGGADNPPLDPTKPVVEYSELRVLNAIPDAPKLSITIGVEGQEAQEATDTTPAIPAIEDTQEEVFWDLDYGDTKPFFAVPAGTDLTVTVYAEMPGVYKFDPETGVVVKWAKNPAADPKDPSYDKNAPALIVDNVNGKRIIETSTVILYKGVMDFAVGAKQDFVLSGALANGGLDVAKILDTAIDTTKDPENTDYSYNLTSNAVKAAVAISDTTGITFGNFTSSLATNPIDIYVVPDCSSISGTPLVDALAAGDSISVALPTAPTAPNVNELCITQNGNTTAIFDYGDFVPVEGMWVNAIDNTNGIAGESEMSLAVQNGASYRVVASRGDDAEFRVINAAKTNDGTGIDMTLGGVNIAAGLGFANASVATAVTSGTGFVSQLNETGSATIVETNTGIAVSDGQTSTVLAYNVKTDIETVTLTDDRRSVASEARVRFIQGSKAFDNVNIYVLDQADGVAFDDLVDPDEAESGYIASPVLTAATKDDISLSLAPGTYQLAITKAAVAAVIDEDDGTEISPAVAEDRTAPIINTTFTVALGDVSELVVIDATATTAQVVTLP